MICWGEDLSDGGLLQKALDQQANDLVAEVANPVQDTDTDTSIKDAIVAISLLAVLPLTLAFLFVMWSEIHLPWLMPSVAALSLAAVWWRLGIGLPDSMGGGGVNQALATLVTVSFTAVLAGPVILGLVLEGELSVGQVEYSEDGEQIEVKLRQNGGEEAEVTYSIHQSDIMLLTGSETVSISMSDSFGDYGELTIPVSRFYSENALPSNPYSLTISVDGSGEWVRELDSIVLSRNVTSTEGSASGVVKSDPDCSGDVDSCLVGVVLTGWAGLMANAGNKPGGLPYADYTLQATLMEGSSVAVQFPEISVTKTAASWDSNGGEFGTGSATVGYAVTTSEIPLEGSVPEPSFNGRSYIPRADFDSAGDYGCYSFVVSVSQDGVSEEFSHTSYYEFTSSNGIDLWNAVSKC